jgi:hypothetical protein
MSDENAEFFNKRTNQTNSLNGFEELSNMQLTTKRANILAGNYIMARPSRLKMSADTSSLGHPLLPVALQCRILASYPSYNQTDWRTPRRRALRRERATRRAGAPLLGKTTTLLMRVQQSEEASPRGHFWAWLRRYEPKRCLK